MPSITHRIAGGSGGTYYFDDYEVDNHLMQNWSSGRYPGTLDRAYANINRSVEGGHIRMAVYESGSKEFVAQSDEIYVPSSGTPIWISGSFPPSSIKENTDYRIVVWSDEKKKYFTLVSGSGDDFYKQAGTSNDGKDYSASGSGDWKTYFPTFSPWDDWGSASFLYKWSHFRFYAEYYTGEYPEINKYNGCTSSGSTTATITSKLINGSGTAYFYWNKDSDPGQTIVGWSDSSNKGWQTSGTTLSEDLTGLNPNSKYYYRAYIVSGTIDDWSDAVEFYTNPIQLSITNHNGCTSSGNTTATITAYVDGGSGNVYLYYGKTDEGTTASSWDNNTVEGMHYETDTISSDISNLLPNTTYYYRAYLSSNGNGDDWANSTEEFKTTIPTSVVVTNASGCVASSATTMTLSAKVSAGSGNVTWYYESGAAGGGTIKDNWENNESYGSVSYSGDYVTKQITGLLPGYTYSFRSYISSNGWYGGEDWASSTDTITTTSIPGCNKDLKIYYGNLGVEDFMCCRCSRWDVSDYSITIETTLNKSQLQILRNHITPGAAGELYKVLGEPTYYDQTWTGDNTIKISPHNNGTSTLYKMRGDKLIYVKNITDSPAPGEKGLIQVKIEGLISGSVI